MSDFDDLATKLAAGVRATARSRLAAPDIRRILRFFSKVALVVDQALEDVLALAIDLSFIRPHELTDDRIVSFQREIELLVSRSHYRDMEEICSRLGMLRMQYDTQIRNLLQGVDTAQWGSLFSLIDEREGYVVYLVNQSVDKLGKLLEKRADAAKINKEARSIVRRLRKSLLELRSTTNSILGLSGSPGLMELTVPDREEGDQEPILEMYDMSNSKNVYFGDNAVFTGNLAVAESIQDSFNIASKTEDGKLQEALNKLSIEVAKLCEQLPEDDQQTASRRLKTMVEEATAKKPDKSVLSVSANGLLEAAKAVAAMVSPITTAVKGVLSLFGLNI
jgi:hypothetical protein